MNNKKESETVVDSTGFLSIKNMPTNEEIERFYEEHYFQDQKTRPKSYQLDYDERERKHIDLMNDLCFQSIYSVRPQWNQSPGTLLEIGVGEGFTLSRAEFHGWKVHGVDFGDFGLKKFNPKLLNILEKGNILKILKNYQEQNKKFDVIIIKNVLEHVVKPRELLKILGSLLSENGILVITIPNDFSKLQLRAYELGHINEKFWLVPPQHLHYFNTENIRPFIEENNFSVIDMYSSFPIDFFLFHSGSNYIVNEKNSKHAHRARIELEILMAENNLENYHQLCKLLSLCHMGRNLTILVEPKNK